MQQPLLQRKCNLVTTSHMLQKLQNSLYCVYLKQTNLIQTQQTQYITVYTWDMCYVIIFVIILINACEDIVVGGGLFFFLFFYIMGDTILSENISLRNTVFAYFNIYCGLFVPLTYNFNYPVL